jgi:methionine-gamma-lyase
MKFQTVAIHAGQQPDPSTGALNTPVYLTSTYSYGTAEEGKARFAGQNPGYIYSRFANPTSSALEQKLAALEGADEAIVVASGMAAISSIVYALTQQGDEVAFIDPVYGGTDSFLRNTLVRAGVTVTSYRSDDDFVANHSPNTRLVLWEPVTNPTLKVIDSRKIVRIAKQIGAITVCDNTFLTPYLFRPLELGIDLVMHSGTKYLCGHGDIIAGVIAGNGPLIQRVHTVALKHLGVPMGPQEAYLLQRGVKTLPLRMQAHCENAAKVAAFLASHPKVAKVYFPGLPSHLGHQVIADTASGFGGMVALDLAGGFADAARFLDNLNLFAQAVSLGDLESLACHPASTTHAAMSAEDRAKAGVTEQLVRLSIGVEDADDLIEDLARALSFLA